ncbi:phage tail protein [Bradyrhizobium yuanmingense]|uniref:phage tail protein n=1 Tax=Bradyrhizobium yuanmingense TaxID=108015 RepID=UPI0023B8A16E|nr:phage tail protein [Bradyrhizobium yuanmingense]MDF0495372.1 phage tail protein [Bradyrhizobium yuanmingense]
MPSDANGVYSLPGGYLAITGETIQASQHNPPLEDLAAAMSQRLMRSGAAPMTGPHKIVDGSAGSPAIQFANASSTGFFKTANGFAVSVDGTQVVEFTSNGILKNARFIGEIFDWTGTTAPALCVLPYGQTLSRTTYADLWAFAQTEIAAGNTFYNNGNGTTTFGIGDCRGRVRASRDNMGGSAAGRLTDASSGFGDVIGESGGAQTKALATENLPPYTPSGTNSGGAASLQFTTRSDMPGGGSSTAVTNIVSTGGSVLVNANVTQPTFTGTAQGGTSTPFSVVQPTIIMNCALFAGGPV